MDGIETNRARWDERAALHGQDGYYDVEAVEADGRYRVRLGDQAMPLTFALRATAP